MKKASVSIAAAAVFLTVCVLGGCMSLEGGSGSSASSSGPARSPTGSPVGVLFDWSSEAAPVSANIPANGIVPSGYGNINFAAYSANSIAVEGGAINLASGRTLLVGATQESLAGATGTGSGDNVVTAHYPGQFDLSQGTFRITVAYRDYNPPAGDTWFRVLINNNSGGQYHSVLGVDNMLRHYTTADTLLAEGSTTGLTYEGDGSQIVLTFTPSVRYARVSSSAKDSLGNAFIGIRCNDTTITITGIKLERIE